MTFQHRPLDPATAGPVQIFPMATQPNVPLLRRTGLAANHHIAVFSPYFV